MAMGKGMPVTTTWMGMVQAWAEEGRGRETLKNLDVWERGREAGKSDWGGCARGGQHGRETTCARCQWPREVGHRVRQGTGRSMR